MTKCAWCGHYYKRKTRSQRYCSIACRNAYANTVPRKPRKLGPRPTKVCLRCGRVFEKPRNAGKAHWDKRKMCSRACNGKIAVGIVRGTDVTDVRLNRRTRQQRIDAGYYARACEICEFDRFTVLAHVIPAAQGGTMERVNILTLCPNHHALFDRKQLTASEYAKISARVDAAIAHASKRKREA